MYGALWSVSFFFVKQKTAYEMRISDWSSDVCSSDLDRLRIGRDRLVQRLGVERQRAVAIGADAQVVQRPVGARAAKLSRHHLRKLPLHVADGRFAVQHRSEERRAGKECVSPCRSRVSPYH